MRTRAVRDLGERAVGALRSPLYGSGYALLANVAGTTAIGFVYWAVAAHLYSAQAVGRNSALISALLLVSNFAQLNLHSTLPRFLPRAGRTASRLIAYGYGVGSLAALALGVVFVTVLPRVNSNWRFVGESALLAVTFAAGTVLWGVFNLEDAALVGLRRAVVVPMENTVYGAAKLLVLVGVAMALPATGIFVSWVVPLLVVIPAVNWLIFRRYLTGGDYAAVAGGLRAREVVRFASIDYVGAAIGQGAWNLLPLLVLSALGAAANGNFYIAFTIASGLTLVTANFSYSLLAEGALAPHRLPELTRGVILRCAIITLPAAALLVVAAPLILRIYGPGYADHASVLLGLLAVSAIPTGLVTIAFSLDRLAGRVGRAAYTQAVRAALILGGSWLLMGRLGINGVGLACVGGSLIVAVARFPTIADAARRRVDPGAGAHTGGWPGFGTLPRLGRAKLLSALAWTPAASTRAGVPASPVAKPAQAQAASRQLEDADTDEFAVIRGPVAETPTSSAAQTPRSPSGPPAPKQSSGAGGGTTRRRLQLDRGTRRILTVAVGYLLLAALQLVVLVRDPHRFEWGSAWGIVYLIALGLMALVGAVGLARGLRRTAPQPENRSRTVGHLS